VHTCIGQEWVGVAVAAPLREDDYIFSNHRGHGHFLARTGNVAALIAEVMGKTTGACKGIGGSQHLQAMRYFSNGIQGGMVPIAAGTAMDTKLARRDRISVVFIGDGTLGEGALYEALNIAARWELPLLVVLENNGYAQSTATRTTTAGSIEGRATGLGLAYRRSDTWDPLALLEEAYRVVGTVRSGSRPLLWEIETYRLRAHSKDDNREKTEIERFAQRDFLTQVLGLGDHDVESLVAEVEREIDEAVLAAEAAPDCAYSAEPTVSGPVEWSAPDFAPVRGNDAVYQGLRSMLTEDPYSVLIGEDIEGPYGGAFKATKDLSQLFPSRVRNTPISESAITGVATGLALAGRRAVVEIMFGDFLSLTFDQLLQHASKFVEIFGERRQVPVVVRTPMGGRRGYGPTHSQSTEKHFLGIPNLTVLALNGRVSPSAVYDAIRRTLPFPALVIENKILYTRPLRVGEPDGFSVRVSKEPFPTVKISPVGRAPDVTIACYGGMLDDAEATLHQAFDELELACEIVCPSRIDPLNVTPIAESVARTGKLVTMEEGTKVAAWGAEVVARLCEAGQTPKRIKRLSPDAIIPSSFKREMDLLPGSKHLMNALREIANG
jgi:2-oxoisovalerate dehydrogenase E1 component